VVLVQTNKLLGDLVKHSFCCWNRRIL